MASDYLSQLSDQVRILLKTFNSYFVSRVVYNRINLFQTEKEKNNIPQDTVNHLIVSIYDRVNMILNIEGHTDY